MIPPEHGVTALARLPVASPQPYLSGGLPPACWRPMCLPAGSRCMPYIYGRLGAPTFEGAIGAVDPVSKTNSRYGSQTARGNQYWFRPCACAVSALERPGACTGWTGQVSVRLRFECNTVAWVSLQILAGDTYEAGLRGPVGDAARARTALQGRHASIRRDAVQ